MTHLHRGWFQRNPCARRLLIVRLRSGDDLELRDTFDGDIDRGVLSADVSTFAVRIPVVADSNNFPIAAAPPAIVVPLMGHVVPVVRPV
jgi:hypothetical protein